MKNYSDQPALVQIVYIRLIDEFERRRQNGLYSSKKAIEGLLTAVEKLAEKANMPPEQFYAELKPIFLNGVLLKEQSLADIRHELYGDKF